jgi:hypothetical protein
MLPAELLRTSNFQATSDASVYKPIYGSLGSMFAEFRVHEEYLGGESARVGREVKRPVEIVIIQSDKFSRVPKRVGNWETGEASELSRKEQIDLAPLYERFKAQKDSTDTNILNWEAVTDMEKGHLAQLGIWTVEQLHNMQEHERFRLGPGWKDLHDRAVRHIATKRGDDERSERERELELLREENRKLAEKQKESEERYFELQASIAKLERGHSSPSRNRSAGNRPKKSLEQEQLSKAEA